MRSGCRSSASRGPSTPCEASAAGSTTTWCTSSRGASTSARSRFRSWSATARRTCSFRRRTGSGWRRTCRVRGQGRRRRRPPRRRPGGGDRRDARAGSATGYRPPAAARRFLPRPPRSADRARERQGAGLGLDRVARLTRKADQRIDPDRVLRPPPGSADLAFDQQRARPDAGRPEPLALILARNQQLALRSEEQEVGIAARQQARWRGDRLGSSERPARPLRAATRRRAASEPGAASLPATQTSRPPSASRSRPSGRIGYRSRARRRGGNAGRARDARRPGRSSAGRPPRRPARVRHPSESRACRSSSRT